MLAHRTPSLQSLVTMCASQPGHYAEGRWHGDGLPGVLAAFLDGPGRNVQLSYKMWLGQSRTTFLCKALSPLIGGSGHGSPNGEEDPMLGHTVSNPHSRKGDTEMGWGGVGDIDVFGGWGR